MIFEKKVVGIYESQFLNRCDDHGLAHYFSHTDFPGLRQQPFDFKSSLGHQMKGWFYCYDEIIPGRVVVFDHGFGGGHRSYMKEIEKLCRHGYLVYTYDHTGCMESGGENPRGLAQSLRDLNDALAMSISHLAKIPIQNVYLISDLSVLMLSLSYIPFRRIAYSLLTVILSGQIIGLLQQKRKEIVL